MKLRLSGSGAKNSKKKLEGDRHPASRCNTNDKNGIASVVVVDNEKRKEDTMQPPLNVELCLDQADMREVSRD